MSQANTNESLRNLLNQMEGFVSTKAVVGEPVTMGDMILLPLIDVSLGAGAGQRNKEKYAGVGGGVTAKMSPSAVLVIQNGKMRLVSIKNQDTVSKALDMVPDIIDKIRGTHKEDDKAVKEAVEKMDLSDDKK